MHARYFSSNLGRFLSVDPVGGEVGSSQSWNRYSYVRNNPIKLVDPDGRKEDDDKQQPTLADLEDSIRAVLQGFFGNQVMLIANPDPRKRGPYMRVSSSGKVSDPIPLAGNPALDRNDP